MTKSLTQHTQHNLSTLTDDWTQSAHDWLSNLNSEQTRKTYQRAWKQFIEYTGKYPQDVTQSDVIGFKTHLSEEGQANSTINLKLSALSSFYSFSIERGLLSDNPCDGVKRLAVKPYGKVTYLDAKENQDMLLLEQPDMSTLIGKRDYAILLILLTTGVRVSAIVNATVKSVKPSATGYVLEYLNKGGETQTANVLPFVYEAIQDYIKARGVVDTKSLFTTVATYRTSFTVKKLTRHAITAMISRYAKQAGLHHVTAHSLRHTAAMIAHKSGTVAQVKAFLRHSSARVTAIYLDHVGDEDVSKMTSAVGSRYTS